VTFYWEGFTAANKALGNNIVFENIKDIAQMHLNMMPYCNKKLKSYIIDGQL